MLEDGADVPVRLRRLPMAGPADERICGDLGTRGGRDLRRCARFVDEHQWHLLSLYRAQNLYFRGAGGTPGGPPSCPQRGTRCTVWGGGLILGGHAESS